MDWCCVLGSGSPSILVQDGCRASCGEHILVAASTVAKGIAADSGQQTRDTTVLLCSEFRFLYTEHDCECSVVWVGALKHIDSLHCSATAAAITIILSPLTLSSPILSHQVRVFARESRELFFCLMYCIAHRGPNRKSCQDGHSIDRCVTQFKYYCQWARYPLPYLVFDVLYCKVVPGVKGGVLGVL